MEPEEQVYEEEIEKAIDEPNIEEETHTHDEPSGR